MKCVVALCFLLLFYVQGHPLANNDDNDSDERQYKAPVVVPEMPSHTVSSSLEDKTNMQNLRKRRSLFMDDYEDYEPHTNHLHPILTNDVNIPEQKVNTDSTPVIEAEELMESMLKFWGVSRKQVNDEQENVNTKYFPSRSNEVSKGDEITVPKQLEKADDVDAYDTMFRTYFSFQPSTDVNNGEGKNVLEKSQYELNDVDDISKEEVTTGETLIENALENVEDGLNDFFSNLGLVKDVEETSNEEELEAKSTTEESFEDKEYVSPTSFLSGKSGKPPTDITESRGSRDKAFEEILERQAYYNYAYMNALQTVQQQFQASSMLASKLGEPLTIITGPYKLQISPASTNMNPYETYYHNTPYNPPFQSLYQNPYYAWNPAHQQRYIPY